MAAVYVSKKTGDGIFEELSVSVQSRLAHVTITHTPCSPPLVTSETGFAILTSRRKQFTLIV